MRYVSQWGPEEQDKYFGPDLEPEQEASVK